MVLCGLTSVAMKGRNCHFTKICRRRIEKYNVGRAHKYGMEVVLRQLWQVCACGKWKLPLYKSHRSAHRWGYKPCYHCKISVEHTKRDFFQFTKSNPELLNWSISFKWSDIRMGGGEGGYTITRSHSKQQWQAGLSSIKVWNSLGKASNGKLDFLQFYA